MTRSRAGWILVVTLSSLWLLPAPLFLYLGLRANEQDHFVSGGRIHSFPFRHAQHQVGIFMLYGLGITALVWAVAGVHALWPRRPSSDAVGQTDGAGDGAGTPAG